MKYVTKRKISEQSNYSVRFVGGHYLDFLLFFFDLMKMVIALFIVVDPLGNVPIFMSLTENMDKSQRRKTFRLAILTGLVLLTFFSLVGQNILTLFGITLDSFMIAGGVLLLIVAIRLLVVGGWGEKIVIAESVGAVPIGCPLLVGPGAITTSIFNLQTSDIVVTLTSVLLTFTIVWFILRYIDPIYRILGRNGSLVITRVMALLIASIAVQYVIEGVKASFI
jgi:multiple antibiotic resistance protein